MIRLAHLLVADVNASYRQYRQLFRETLSIDYVELVVRVFEAKLAKSVKPLIDTICQKLPVNKGRPSNKGAEDNKSDDVMSNSHRRNDGTSSDVTSSQAAAAAASCLANVPEFDFRLGVRLFELYLSLKQVQSLSAQYSLPSSGGLINFSNSSPGLHHSGGGGLGSLSQQQQPSDDGLASYHLWFLKAVAKWLDIALVRAIRRIVKAVSLDDLKVRGTQLLLEN